MRYRLLTAVALSLFAPAALATGQEMAAIAAYLIVLVSLVSGLALGALVVAIVLVLSWRRGTLRRHPVRMAVISGAIVTGGPILVFLSIMVGSFIKEVVKYPAQYPWLTGAGPQAPEAQPPAEAPVTTPQRDFATTARDRLEMLAQDVVRWWYYDDDVEEAERRASGQ